MKEKMYQSERFNLRYPMMGDARKLLELSQKQEALSYYGLMPLLSIDEAYSSIATFMEMNRSNDSFKWIISDKNNDEYIGDIGVTYYDRKTNCVELSFKLDPEQWNQGIMTETVNMACDTCFNELYYHRIQVMVATENKSCRALMEKVGFKFEGVLREYEYINNKYVDVAVYSLIESDIM